MPPPASPDRPAFVHEGSVLGQVRGDEVNDVGQLADVAPVSAEHVRDMPAPRRLACGGIDLLKPDPDHERVGPLVNRIHVGCYRLVPWRVRLRGVRLLANCVRLRAVWHPGVCPVVLPASVFPTQA